MGGLIEMSQNLGELRLRKRASLSVKAFKAIECQIRDLLERRLELENCYPSPPTKALKKRPNLSLKIRTLDDLEGLTVDIRKSWNLGLAPIHDLVDVLEMIDCG